MARIYFSFLKNKEPIDNIIMILESKHKLIRHHLGKKINLKYIPTLRFYYDDTFEHAELIDCLIKKINEQD